MLRSRTVGTTLQPGTIFAGDYRVVRPLSSGGMGALYVVDQLSTGKQRALKLMHPELVADGTLRRRFEQEARIGGRIPSDHVVEVQAAGVDVQTGSPYLVMELLEGDDLAAVVAARGPLPPAEARRLMEQLCHAVGAAHAAGIVHRDLKPENVFVARSRRTDVAFTVKVLDFGIAKLMSEQTTQKTAAIGSPLWLAPEQTERGPVTPAADVWALGLIAFNLLTGQPFWTAALAPDSTVTQVMREVLFEPIPRASVRAAERGRQVPPAFDAWFGRCVVRDPRARFADATQAWQALDGALSPSTSIVPRGGAVASGTAAVLGATQPVSAPPAMTPFPGTPPRVTPAPPTPVVPSAPAFMGTPAGLSASAPVVRRKSRSGLWLGCGGTALALLVGGGVLLATCIHQVGDHWQLSRTAEDPKTGEMVKVTQDKDGFHFDANRDGGDIVIDTNREGQHVKVGGLEVAATTRTPPPPIPKVAAPTATATTAPAAGTTHATYHRGKGEHTISGVIADAPHGWGAGVFNTRLLNPLQTCRDAVADGSANAIQVHTDVDTTGKVTHVADPFGTGASEPGVQCMMQVIRTTQFPATPKPVTVNVLVSWVE